VVAANLAAGQRRPSQPWPPGNVSLSAAEAARELLAPVPKLGQLDVQPRQRLAAAIPPEAYRLLRQDVDHDRDFWGNVREHFEQAGACPPSARRRVIEAEPRSSAGESR